MSDVDEKTRAYTGWKMSIPQAELTKRRLRSVSWCILCHATGVACLQAVFLFSPLHPYLWLLATIRSVLCFRFFATLAQISILTAALVYFISKSLPDSVPTVHFSKINFAQPKPWEKKTPTRISIFGLARKSASLIYELPLSFLSGKKLDVLLGNNLTALLVGLLFLNSQNKVGTQLFFFLMAGTFSSLRNSTGHRFLDAAPVVNLPLRTQIRSIFTETVKSLLLPTLKSFLSINIFVMLFQLLSMFWSKEMNLLSIFSHLSLTFLLHTYFVYFFLILLLTTTHKVTLAVFMTNWHFPIEAVEPDTIGLLDALESTNDLKLAASRDLVFVSELDAQRRSEFWVLSQPGGHPKRFNSLVRVLCKAVAKFKDDLTEKVPEINVVKSPMISDNGSPDYGSPAQTSTPNVPPPYLSHTPVQPMARFRGLLYQTPQTPTIRPMESVQSPLRLVPNSNSVQQSNGIGHSHVQSMLGAVKEIFKPVEDRSGTGTNKNYEKYLLKASSTVLTETPFLSFMASGISSLALASIAEDKYGIVQLKLQEIVSSLISLEETAKCHEKMGLALQNYSVSVEDVAEVNKAMDLVQEAASRALCKIGRTFGKSLFDLRWSDKEKETLALFVQ